MKELIIKGNFTISGDAINLVNIQQPLGYIKIRVTEIPVLQVDVFSQPEK